MEIVNSSQFKHLLELLNDAENLVGQFTGGYSNQFFSAEEFHEALVIAILRLQNNDLEVLSTLWLWFAPTCSWDDFTGVEGMNLCNDTFEAIKQVQMLIV
jgi:hypothetical protein